jgi:hypothetical protein
MMVTLEKMLSRWTGVGLGLLLATSASAGEKVRFGTGAGGAIQTQPQRSIRESITPRVASFNQTAPAAAAAPVANPVVTRAVRPEDEDQRNWIFRDTRSAAGMQKALGVDTFEEQGATVAERDSVAVINDYFARQQAQTTASPALGSAAAKSWGDLAGGPAAGGGLGASAIGGSSAGAPSGATSGSLFGDSSFRNSLNSDNQAVRNYFRELYTSPGLTGSGLSSANPSRTASGTPNTRPGTVEQAPATPENQNFLDLVNRAALVDSLSTVPPGAPTLNAPQTVNQPAANGREVPTVNQGNLFERRSGGVIEIPARKF